MKRELFRSTGESDAPQLPHRLARSPERRAQSPRGRSFFRASPPARPRCDSRSSWANTDAFSRLLLSETLTDHPCALRRLPAQPPRAQRLSAPSIRWLSFRSLRLVLTRATSRRVPSSPPDTAR